MTDTAAPSAVARTTSSTAPSTAEPTHKEIVEVLVGLLSALFVAILSTTIVSTALPTIIADLDGTQTQYTWVVTASLLAMTVTSPIWSKFSDLYNKKLLVQLAIGIFVLGSLAAGAVQDVPQLLAARALQGLGMGGLIALTQSIIASIIPPRQRGRYSGYMAGVMAVATVSGPLLGGVIVDSLGWRWCFWVAVPFAVAGLAMLQKFLHVETIRREVRIDVLGALSITAAAALPLVWVSFAGTSFAWWSRETAYFWVGTLLALAAAVVVERRHPDALVPPRIIVDKMTMLSIAGSLAVGVAQFGASVFLSQYFQVARGHTPTEAGLLMLPLIVGNLVGATGSGQYITRTGRWKGVMVLGGVLLSGGLLLMGTVSHTSPLWHLSAYMVVMGLGTGALMQNLVLVVQNTVDVTDVGAASGVVTFFRSLGGTIGVAALGAVLASSVSDRIASALGTSGGAGSTGSTLDLSGLPAPVVETIRAAYADSTAEIFLIAGLVALVTLVAVSLMPVTELRTTIRKTEPEPEQGRAVEDALV
ncbi:MDR family MFS transporter [Nocardioides aurantiacus]|uniref:MFS transporter n=1 Tax=Nocardioides aurantiacus TaxID=86796 RepID=A0A3N2CXW7_9ACTN|nr:MDR family MFS transporter [Nocardioides aurantiacus]ROR92392.1 MFS transporter [Nocardioides aurantiacus]